MCCCLYTALMTQDLTTCTFLMTRTMHQSRAAIRLHGQVHLHTAKHGGREVARRAQVTGAFWHAFLRPR